jgi:hypothetical protein
MTTPGRNDLCPCGSGKKYKKCCLDSKSPVRLRSPPAEVEPRFYSPIRSYYTEGAIVEAMKPGGLVRIHPYALVKMRGDPRFIATAEPEVRARLLQLWRGSTVAAMPTDEVEARLAILGVNYDRAEFLALIPSKQSAWEIGEEWGRGLVAVGSADRDFFGLGACELWRRFCPEKPSVEMIDDWVCEGFALVGQKKPTDALRSWSKVWETIHSRLTPEMRNLSSAGEVLYPRMSQCLSNWSVEFRIECLNDIASGHLGIRFCRQLLAALPAEDENLNVSGDLAMLCFNAGRDEEGEQCCQQMIAKRPDHPSGYVHLSDELVRHYSRGRTDDGAVRRAIELLERALAYPVADAEQWDLAKRLAEARKILPS